MAENTKKINVSLSSDDTGKVRDILDKNDSSSFLLRPFLSIIGKFSEQNMNIGSLIRNGFQQSIELSHKQIKINENIQNDTEGTLGNLPVLENLVKISRDGFHKIKNSLNILNKNFTKSFTGQQTRQQELEADKQEKSIKDEEQRNWMEKLVNSIKGFRKGKDSEDKSKKEGSSFFGNIFSGIGAGIGASVAGILSTLGLNKLFGKIKESKVGKTVGKAGKGFGRAAPLMRVLGPLGGIFAIGKKLQESMAGGEDGDSNIEKIAQGLSKKGEGDITTSITNAGEFALIGASFGARGGVLGMIKGALIGGILGTVFNYFGPERMKELGKQFEEGYASITGRNLSKDFESIATKIKSIREGGIKGVVESTQKFWTDFKNDVSYTANDIIGKDNIKKLNETFTYDNFAKTLISGAKALGLGQIPLNFMRNVLGLEEVDEQQQKREAKMNKIKAQDDIGYKSLMSDVSVLPPQLKDEILGSKDPRKKIEELKKSGKISIDRKTKKLISSDMTNNSYEDPDNRRFRKLTGDDVQYMEDQGIFDKYLTDYTVKSGAMVKKRRKFDPSQFDKMPLDVLRAIQSYGTGRFLGMKGLLGMLDGANVDSLDSDAKDELKRAINRKKVIQKQIEYMSPEKASKFRSSLVEKGLYDKQGTTSQYVSAEQDFNNAKNVNVTNVYNMDASSKQTNVDNKRLSMSNQNRNPNRNLMSLKESTQ